MDAQGFRALAQRCHDLGQIAAGLEVREQLHEWVDDLEAEAEAAEGRHPQMHDDRSDEGPKFLRTAAEEMRSLAERDSLELRRMAADLESAADKILERRPA
jgi:HPt (histidine-containing phosphotransfer) domain-containing protein